MSIVNYMETAAAPARGAARMPFGNMVSPTDRPKAKVWMNVGREVNGKFITIPGTGAPIDTLETLPIRGQNEDFIKQVTAQNGSLTALQQLGASLQPGQEVTLNLVVKLRRVNEELVVDQATNEYAIDPASLLALPAAAE